MISRSARRRNRRRKMGEGKFQAYQKMCHLAKKRGSIIAQTNVIDDMRERGVYFVHFAQGALVDLRSIRQNIVMQYDALVAKIAARRQVANLRPAQA